MAPIRRVTAQTIIEFKLMIRQGENFLLSFGVPIAILILAATLPNFPHPDTVTALDWATPGVLAISIMSSSMVMLGITTGFERYYAVIKRFGVTPLTRWEFFFAKAIAVLLILILQLLVSLGVAWLLGFHGSSGMVLWALPVVVLGTAGFAGLGLLIASRLPAMATLAIVNAVFFLAIGTSGIGFSIDGFPAFVVSIFRLFPALPLVEALRFAMLGSPATLPVLSGISLVAWAALSPYLAVKAFRFS